MDVHECIRRRREVREFRPDPLPADSVRKILEAGRLAPSQRNRQPWHFIVIGNRETLKRIGALASSGPYIADAPLAVAIAISGSKMPLGDATRAVQNMVLAAWTEGIGSCWVSGLDRDAIKELLGIPAEMELITVLPFGYPEAPQAKGNKDRKGLAEVAHLEKFGRPYPQA